VACSTGRNDLYPSSAGAQPFLFTQAGVMAMLRGLRGRNLGARVLVLSFSFWPRSRPERRVGHAPAFLRALRCVRMTQDRARRVIA
jgi:hypothetical protein